MQIQSIQPSFVLIELDKMSCIIVEDVYYA